MVLALNMKICAVIYPMRELSRVISQLGEGHFGEEMLAKVVENHSFEKLSGRRAGDENASSFMRKGIVGDWRNHFDREARVLFNEYAGDALIRLDYEKKIYGYWEAMTKMLPQFFFYSHGVCAMGFGLGVLK